MARVLNKLGRKLEFQSTFRSRFQYYVGANLYFVARVRDAADDSWPVLDIDDCHYVRSLSLETLWGVSNCGKGYDFSYARERGLFCGTRAPRAGLSGIKICPTAFLANV